MADVAYIATYTDTASDAEASVTVTDVEVGDWLVAFIANTLTASADLTPTGTGTGDWVQIGAQLGDPADDEDQLLAAWYKAALSAGSHDVEVDLPNETQLVVVHVRSAGGIDAVSDHVIASTASPAAEQALGPVSVSQGGLLVGGWAGLLGSAFSWSTPSGMTERADLPSPGDESALMVATEATTVAGPAGTRASTASSAPTGGFAGKLIAIRPTPTPVVVATYTDAAVNEVAEVDVADVEVGDWLIAFIGSGYVPDVDLHPTAGQWVALGGQLGRPGDPYFENMGLIAWRTTIVEPAASYNVEVDLPNETTLVVLHIRGAIAVDGLVADRVVSQTATPAATQQLGPVTTTSTSALLIGAWAGIRFDPFTWSTPAGMTERADIADPVDFTRLMVATEVLTVPGATGTRSSTASAAPSFGFAGKLLALRGDGAPDAGAPPEEIEESEPETPGTPTGDPGTGGGGGGAPSSTEAAVVFGWGTPIPEASDEFNGTTLDGAKWGRYGAGGNTGGEECWPGHTGNGRRCVANITVQDGYVRLTGETNGDTGAMASRYNQRYGRWEVRARWFATGASGNPWHPVLIVWPQGDRWPEDGEYDFVENNVGDTELGAFMHYPHLPGPVQQIEFTGPELDFSQWHNFAFEWTSQHVKGFVDGVEWFSASGGAQNGNPARQNIQDMPIGHLTIQLDDFFGGGGMRAAVMDVDWVRTYDLTGPGPGGGSTGGSGSPGGAPVPEPPDVDPPEDPEPPDPEPFPAGHPVLAGTVDAALLVQAAFGADLTEHPNAWSWTDITLDVRQAEGIRMRHGRSDEAGRTQPASCSLVLDNALGRYSLGGQSPYWPNVRRNVPIRVALDPDGGTDYQVLFEGFADSWQPAWEMGARAARVELSASGTLRRLLQGSAPVLSPYRRAVLDSPQLLAYWPCEEPRGATAIDSGLPGGVAMALSGTPGHPWPRFAASDALACSAELPEVGFTSWRGAVPRYTATGQVQFRFLMALPEDPVVEELATLVSLYCSGSAARWDLRYVNTGTGALALRVTNTAGVLTELFFTALAVNGSPRCVSIELEQVGATIQWALRAIAPGDRDARHVSGTLASHTLGRATAVAVAPDGDLDEAAIGHLSVQSILTRLRASDARPFNAWAYELAHDRIARVCRENGVTVEVVGASVVPMGPQPVDELVAILRECEAADGGLLYDGTSAGLTYIAGARRVNQPATLTVTTTQLAAELTPVDDDQNVRNLVTVERSAGGQATYEDVDGPAGTAVVGVYDDSRTVNIGHVDDLIDHASRDVARGTVTGYRYPELELALHAEPGLAAGWLAVTPSARLDLVDDVIAAAQLPTETQPLLVEGYEQRLGQYTWDATVHLSSALPWRAGTWAGDTGDTGEYVLRVDTDDSELAASAAAGATSLSVQTNTGPLWTTVTDDLPLQIEVGGLRVTVTAITGSSSPQTFTVTAADVIKALPAGSPVRLWQPLGPGL